MDWSSSHRYIKRLTSKVLFIGLSLVLASLSSVHAAEDYAIYSLDSEFEPISINKARKLYQGKTKRLNGKRVELSDWPENSTERAEFYQLLLSKNTAQMNAHWASLSFSGKARYPRELNTASADSLINWLNDKPNRIGYSPLSSVPESANILYVIGSEK